MAGITDRPVADGDEERGVIRDASGHPSGVLLEAGMQLADAGGRRPHAARGAAGHAARPPAHYLNSFGITSVVNATGESGGDRALWHALRDRGR